MQRKSRRAITFKYMEKFKEKKEKKNTTENSEEARMRIIGH